MAEWTKGRMLETIRQATCRNKPGYMRKFRTFCAMRSCKSGMSQYLPKGVNETLLTPFPIAFSTLHCMSTVVPHPYEKLTSSSIPLAHACPPLVVNPLLITLSPTSARPVQARHSTSGVIDFSSRHVLSALNDNKSDSE